MFAQLGDEELSEIRERAAHVNEVPQCASSVPKLQWYEAKAAELGVSVRTIKRWVRAFLLDRESRARARRPGSRERGHGRAGPG